MKILPYPIDHFFRPGGKTADGPAESHRPRPQEDLDAIAADRVEISAQGRKEQIQREMVTEIIRKIR